VLKPAKHFTTQTIKLRKKLQEWEYSVLVSVKVVLYGHNFIGDEAVQKWLLGVDR
jgi:hypothetical protein